MRLGVSVVLNGDGRMVIGKVDTVEDREKAMEVLSIPLILLFRPGVHECRGSTGDLYITRGGARVNFSNDDDTEHIN
jgi:hypothetical protein